MPSTQGQSDRVVLAMAPGRNRTLLLEWLEPRSNYEVVTTDAEGSLPQSYDLCLLDVACFRAFREELAARIDAADAVYLPHVLLVGSKGTTGRTQDRLPDFGSIADALVDEILTLPVEKAVLHRRLENLLTTRRTSLRLAEREDQYQQLVELTPEGIVLVDDDEIVYANPAANRLLGGRAGADLTGQSLRSFVTAESEASFERLLESVASAETGIATEFTEFAFRRADGREVDVSLAGVPVTYDGEHAVQLVLRDITEEKRRKEQIQLFGRAVESVGVGVTITDAQQADNPIVYANEGFQRLTGYQLGEVLGRNCRFLQGPRTSEATRETIREALRAGEPVSTDILNYRKNGTTFWNHLDITPVHDDEGELTHFIGFQRNITEAVQHKQRLAVLNRILRHNVRNKTNVISGYAVAIQRGDAAPDDAAKRIADAAKELLTISEQIREFDAVIEDRGSDSERVDLETVVEDGVAAIRENRPDATVDVTIETAGGETVAAHHTLRAALANFFDLLAQAPTPSYTVGLEPLDGQIEFVVVDRSGTLSAEELGLVETGTESALEHLTRLELWLLRWAVEHSDGSFEVETRDGYPLLRLRFDVAD